MQIVSQKVKAYFLIKIRNIFDLSSTEFAQMT